MIYVVKELRLHMFDHESIHMVSTIVQLYIVAVSFIGGGIVPGENHLPAESN